jgi:lysyl endopeptidase
MKKYLLTPVVFCISLIGFAQLSTNEVPLSFKENLNRDSIPQVKLSAPDFNQINKQDSIDNLNGLPPRFGYGIEVNLTTENSGKWVDLPNSRGRLWQLEIYSPGALSINLLYDKFYIPPGGKFFVYSVDKKKILGAFTERNNKGDKIQPGAFATSLILKDRIIIEYFNPSYSNEIPIISVNKVVHGYKYIHSI